MSRPQESADTDSKSLVGLSSHGLLLLTRVHYLARFTSTDGVGDVHVDGEPVNSLPRTALGGLCPTVAIIEACQDAATKDCRDHHTSIILDEVAICLEVVSYLTVRAEEVV